ncbi:MAG: MFS transporter [Rhodothermaceae bacterium]|nr:MAG: MFS transporter [Rhodothermaceae bacterium]
MAALDIAIVGPALPAIGEHFGVSERTLAWVFNTFVLFNLMGVPLMAKLSDVLGRRAIYAADVALFAAGSLVVALAPTFGVLLVGRALQGLAASGIFPVASAVVGDVFPPERRGRALGVLGAVFGLAFIIGPILGGVLLLFGWPWLFVVNLPLAAVVFVASLRMLPGRQEGPARRIDWGGILTLGGMLVALAYGINQIDAEQFAESLRSPRLWGALAVAAGLFPVFLRVERRAPEPLLRLGLFQSRQVVLASLLAAGAGMTEAAFIFFPALAVAAFGVTKSTASFMLLPLVVAVAVASPVAGRVLDRVGSKTIILVSTTLLALGLATVGAMGTVETFFYAGSVLMGFGLAGLLGSSLSYILLQEAQASERAVAQGVITLFISIGQMTASAFIGALAASSGGTVAGYRQAILVIAAVAGVLALLAFGLKGRAAEQAAFETAGDTR